MHFRISKLTDGYYYIRVVKFDIADYKVIPWQKSHFLDGNEAIMLMGMTVEEADTLFLQYDCCDMFGNNFKEKHIQISFMVRDFRWKERTMARKFINECLLPRIIMEKMRDK